MDIWARLLRCVPVTMVMGIIFFLSHHEGSELPLPEIPGLDKLLHAVAYGILAAAAIFAFMPATRRRQAGFVGLTVLLFSILFGISDEFHQSFVPGRFPAAGDILADTAGAALVVYGWYRLSVSRQRKDVR